MTINLFTMLHNNIIEFWSVWRRGEEYIYDFANQQQISILSMTIAKLVTGVN